MTSNNNIIDDSNNNIIGYSDSHNMESLSFPHSSFHGILNEEFSNPSSNSTNVLFEGQMHLFSGSEFDRSQSAPPFSYSEDKFANNSDLNSSKDDPSAVFGLSHQHQQQDPNNQFFFHSSNNNNFNSFDTGFNNGFNSGFNNGFSNGFNNGLNNNNNAAEPEWMQQHQQNFASNGFYFSNGPNVMGGPFLDQHQSSSSSIIDYNNSPPLKSSSMTARKSRPLIGAAEMTPRADGAKNFSMLEKMIPLDPAMRYTKSQKIEMAASYLTELREYYESLVRELDNLKDQNKTLNWELQSKHNRKQFSEE